MRSEQTLNKLSLTDPHPGPLPEGEGDGARVLVNATTCTKGGALQMATMFLQQAIRAGGV